MSKESKGVITVFTALSMLIIISLLLCLVQSCAVSVGKNMSNQAHVEAQRALMSNYCKEIYDNYHIFMMDGGYSKEKLNEDNIISWLEYYVSPSVNPALVYKNKSYSAINVTGFEYDKISDIRYRFITDNDGELFIDQAVQYMKYQVGESFAKDYVKKFTIFKSGSELAQVIKKKQEIFQKSANMSDDIMKLMMLIDGVSQKSGEVVYSSNGRIVIAEDYAKKVVQSASCKEDIGINNEGLFVKIKNQSYVISEALELIIEDFEDYKDDVNDELKDNIKTDKKICKSDTGDFVKAVKGALKSSKSAIELIDKICKDKNAYNQGKDEFNTYLKGKKDKLPENIYDGLFVKDDENEDILRELPAIKDRLQKNIPVLERLSVISAFSYESKIDVIDKNLATLNELLYDCGDYTVQDISFDYKGLEVKKPKESYLAAMKEVLSDGIIKLIIDDDVISKKKLKEKALPSGGKADTSNSISSDIVSGAGGTVGESIGFIGNVISRVGEGVSAISSVLRMSSGKMLDRVLFSEYVNRSFNMYNRDGLIVNGKLNHALDYEKEYILSGNRTDAANIKVMINRILGIRILFNMITLMTDGALNSEARKAASLLFGFTGVPAIVEIAKIIIQVIWAFEESLVDACALVKGYLVPVYKEASQIKIRLENIPLISKSLIRKKAETYKGGKCVAGMSYDTYLDLFLLGMDRKTMAYRCMDLIQSNINLTYGTSIRMKNMIHGIESKISFRFPLKYMTFRLNRDVITSSFEDREYQSVAAYSY